MPTRITVTFTNDTTGQHVYTITDDVLGRPVFDNQPLAPEESTTQQLVTDEDGKGRATYGFRGGVNTSRNDLRDGETVRMN